MWRTLSYVFWIELKFFYDMYKFIYQFSSFWFNINLMLWWEENDAAVKPQVITIISYLVGPLISHGGDLPVSQLLMDNSGLHTRYPLCT